MLLCDKVLKVSSELFLEVRWHKAAIKLEDPVP